ncbi:MAG: Ig-like domain-containing protein [Nitrospirota bacterium]
MKKNLILLILISAIFSMISCGGGAGSSSSPPGEDTDVPFSVELRPSQYVVQTNGFIYMKARVLNGNGNPISNIPVYFTNLSSLVPGLSATSANTDSSGYATVTASSTSYGFMTVQAEVDNGTGKIRDRKTVYFSIYDLTWPTTAFLPHLTLDVDGTPYNGLYNEPDDYILLQDEEDIWVKIMATVYDGYDNPVSNSTVTFGTDSTEASFLNDEYIKTTNSEGQAFAYIMVNPTTIRDFQTVLNVTASADNGAANMVTLFLEAVTVTNIAVTANPSIVETEGSSIINAVVTLNTGSTAPDGTTVGFTTCDAATCTSTCGFVTPFAQTSGGVATADFTAPSTAGTCKITATAGGMSGSTNVTVKLSVPLSVIPTTQTIADPAVSDTATYTILGGTGPFSAYSSHPSLVIVAVTDSTLTATVASVPTEDTTVTITVYDTSNGDHVSASLILDVPPIRPISVVPSSQTVNGAPGGTATFTIFGGVEPYSVYTNNPSFPPDPESGITSGGAFTVDVPPNTPVTTVTYIVMDSVGSTATATLNITSVTTDYYLLPESATIIVDGAMAFTIFGGVEPFDIFQDNMKVDIQYDETEDPRSFTVVGIETGSVTITVRDANGRMVEAIVTIE